MEVAFAAGLEDVRALFEAIRDQTDMSGHRIFANYPAGTAALYRQTVISTRQKS